LQHSQDTPESRKAQLEPFQQAKASADHLLGYKPKRTAPSHSIPASIRLPLAPQPQSLAPAAAEQAQPMVIDPPAQAPSFPLSTREDGMIPLLEEPSAELQAENAKLKEQLEKALSLNELLWKGVVEGTLKLDAQQS
jgi:hypothetical protein